MAESSEGDAGKVPNLGERQLELFYAFYSVDKDKRTLFNPL